jgi:hypothetical protein
MDNGKRRLARFFDRVASITFICMMIGITGMVVCGVIIHPYDEQTAAVTGLLFVLTIITSGMLYAVARLVRDFAVSPRTQVRFSVRSLLVAMTLLALALGAVGYLFRK